MKWSGLFLLLLFIVTNVSGQIFLNYGFNQVDFSGSEGNGRIDVVVIKENENVGDFVLTLSKFTIQEFNDRGLMLPTELVNNVPDPAEAGEFDSSPITVTFPPSPNNEQQIISINITNDNILEPLEEGFYLVATVSGESDQVDATNSMPLRNGVALINIVDDDELTFTFTQDEFTVEEQEVTIDDQVFVEKSGVSEIPLTLFVNPVEANAEQGIDFGFPDGFMLMFDPGVSSLNVPVDIFDDNMAEVDEIFSLQLSIPANISRTFGLGAVTSARFTILDMDSAVIGFEQQVYTANEDDGFVMVCVGVQSGAVSSSATTLLGFSDVQDTAEGAGVDYEEVTFPIPPGFVSPRFCFNVTLIDDLMEEGSEQFNVTGEIVFSLLGGRLEFIPDVTTILILDNDQAATTPTPASTTDGGGFVTITPATTQDPDSGGGGVSMGGDPHFSVLLPNGQLICYSIQGEHGFTFNLISNEVMQVNAHFVADDHREEVTWISAMGIVVKGSRYKQLQDTRLRFVAKEGKIFLGDRVKLDAMGVARIQLAGGKLTLDENEMAGGRAAHAEVDVVLEDVGLEFSVRFVKGNHLDMVWKKVLQQSTKSHGLIGQFFRNGVEVDEARRLLQLPNMEPVPVMRKPVWHFMERETPEDQLCWVAMNPGYQGKRLIEGNYLDYLVDDVLASKFTFKKKY